MFKSKIRGLILLSLIAVQGLPQGGVASAQPLCVPVIKCAGLLGAPRIRTSIIPAPDHLFLYLPVGGAAQRVTMLVRTDGYGQFDPANYSYKLFKVDSASGKASSTGAAGKVVTYDCEEQAVRGEQATYLCTAVR